MVSTGSKVATVSDDLANLADNVTELTNSKLTVATMKPNLNAPKGHTVIGLDDMFFDQTVRGAGSNVKGIPLTWQNTVLRAREGFKPSAKNYNVVEIPITKTQRSGANNVAGNYSGGSYNILCNSCTTTGANIIRGAGFRVPTTVRTPAQLNKWAQKQEKK